MMRSQWMSGIGGMIMASAALLWVVDPAGDASKRHPSGPIYVLLNF